MTKPIKILVALKLIEKPDDILKYSQSIANKYSATLFPLHVIPDMPHYSFYMDIYQLWEEFRDEAVKQTLKQMTKYLNMFENEFKDVEPMIKVGEPAEVILDVAEKLDVDLIIIGKHRHQKDALSFFKQGSAERIVRESTRPVLCVPL